MRVGIVFGGPSVEHDISIITASQIFASIDKKKYDVMLIYYSKDRKFYQVRNLGCVEKFEEDIKLLDELTINRLGAKKRGKFRGIKTIDCFICAFHGKNMEGGELAGYFETLGIPYTSSGVLGSSVGQDKIIMKKILSYDEINVVPYVCINGDEFRQKKDIFIDKINILGYPVIVKPSMLGSSIGIKVAKSENELLKSLNLALKYDNFVIVEKALSNFREFNCAIIGELVSEIEEVEVKNDIFSFSDKYESNNRKTILPAIINNELKDQIIEITKKTSASLRNESLARIDFLYDNDNEILYVNEINTIPGALSYYLFEEKGIYFDELIDILINNAMKKDYKNKLLINSFNSNVLKQRKNNKLNK